MLEQWFGFLVTLVLRFVGGFLMGCVVGFIVNWQHFMFGVANKRLPWHLLTWWGVVGGIILFLTVPKHARPWHK